MTRPRSQSRLPACEGGFGEFFGPFDDIPSTTFAPLLSSMKPSACRGTYSTLCLCACRVLICACNLMVRPIHVY